MKKHFTTLLAAVALLGAPSWAAAKEINVTVKGMVCSFCAQGIKKKLSAESAVNKVDVNLGQHLVKIDTKKDQDLTDEKITSILKDAGYSVSKIERK